MRNSLDRMIVDFQKNRHYIYTAALLFAIGMYVGYSSELFHDFLNSQIEGLIHIAGDLMERENSMLWFFLFIFFNNTIKSIAVIFLGFFLGVLPVIFLLVNGMVLGYVYLIILEGGGSLGQLLVGILPHGIIELPIIIIACAYGLKLGAIVWISIFQMFTPDSKSKGQVSAFIKKSLPLVVFITIALLIAAAIESTITPWLIQALYS